MTNKRAGIRAKGGGNREEEEEEEGRDEETSLTSNPRAHLSISFTQNFSSKCSEHRVFGDTCSKHNKQDVRLQGILGKIAHQMKSVTKCFYL